MATMAESGIKGYTTYGGVRGQCGHLHKTRKAAERCLDRDSRGCRASRGYSDRDVYAVDLDGYLTHGDSDWVRGSGGRTSDGVKFHRD
jgi:hypothetical protein